MKKNYKLKLLTALVVSGVSIGGANAFNPKLTATTIITENSENWVEVKNENGIKVFFSKVNTGGSSYLKIKFENTTGKLVEFSWSLSKKNKVITKELSNKIKTLSTIEIYDASMLIPINNGESLTDFSVIINLK